MKKIWLQLAMITAYAAGRASHVSETYASGRYGYVLSCLISSVLSAATVGRMQ